MEMSPEIMGYDRAIVVFSPDGRLFQVEYAREAVKKGSTVVGVRYDSGVILATTRKKSKVIVAGEKIFKVDDHIAIASAGLVADSRVLIDLARIRAQQNKLIYDEPISVRAMAKFIADRQQLYTQYAGVRPYGVSLLVAGMNKEPSLFETDPSGVMIESKARAIGRNSTKINEFFEKHYKEKLNLKGGIELAINGLKKDQAKISKDALFIVLIDKSGIKEMNGKDVEKLGIKI